MAESFIHTFFEINLSIWAVCVCVCSRHRKKPVLNLATLCVCLHSYVNLLQLVRTEIRIRLKSILTEKRFFFGQIYVSRRKRQKLCCRNILCTLYNIASLAYSKSKRAKRVVFEEIKIRVIAAYVSHIRICCDNVENCIKKKKLKKEKKQKKWKKIRVISSCVICSNTYHKYVTKL